jgi:beta-fructofuranosidase
VFVDHSVIEVFANGHTCLASRVYPTRPDSLGVELFATGASARLAALDVWQMAAIWPAASATEPNG